MISRRGFLASRGETFSKKRLTRFHYSVMVAIDMKNLANTHAFTNTPAAQPQAQGTAM